MLYESLKWALAALSLAGVVLNVRRRRACFYVWSFTNCCWAAVDLAHGVYAQAALQSVYFGLAVWGVFAWRPAPAPEGGRP